jgi:ABC-type multidrug transport system permease subunit
LRRYRKIQKNEEWLQKESVSLGRNFKRFIKRTVFKTEIFTPIEEKTFSPLSKNERGELRKNRLREIEMFEIIYEIIFHFMFFWILYVVCYSNTNSETFRSQKNMKEMFVSSNLKYDFTNVIICFSF